MTAQAMETAATPRAPRNFRIAPLSVERRLTLAAVGVIALAWVLASHYGWANPLFLPPPAKVAEAFWRVATRGYQGSLLHEHLAASLARVLEGYLVACAIGIPLGLAMGFSTRCKAVFDPLIEFYRPLPPLALYTLLVMWLGIGDLSKVALLFLAALPPLTISAMEAAKSVDVKYVKLGRSLGASRGDLLRHIYVPACLPGICTGMRISLGFTYTVLVAAEIVAADRGVGWMIWDASKFLLSDVVIMGLFVLAVTGLVLDWMVRRFERAVTSWRYL